MSEQASIAKITRPRLSGIASRDRLFCLLDEGRNKPITWVAAPAGSGKTTLVASWLDSRVGKKPPPTIWYQVDEGDSDLATFFYYMGLAVKKAAPGHKKPLPLLTPEYLQGIPTFTRRYFENLFSLLKTPFTIVLDNYQDAPLKSGFHEMISHALDVIPGGVNVVVISRGEPPAQLSRLKANNKISFLGWNEVRFSSEEAGQLLRMKSGKKLPDDKIRQLQEKTDGWAAGLILVLESARRGGFQTLPDTSTFQAVFDYFANEIFAGTDNDTQQFLLKTSFLPTMTARMADKLTGIKQSDQILSGLSRNHYFTDWRPLPEPVFQYHPLFREFLLTKAKEVFSEDELSNTRRSSALLLAGSGNAEDAAGLFRDAEDWEGLTKLILTQARPLVMQGRNKTLEQWISGMPKKIVGVSPWILYWLGICRMAYNPTEARGHFDKAYNLFKEEQALSGVFLSWSAIIDTFVYEWGDFRPLERWIEEIESYIADNPDFPSPEIEARVATGFLNALMWRQPSRNDLPIWAERVQNIVLSHPSVQFRVMLGNHLIIYYLWIGDFAKARLIIENLRQVANSKTKDPLTRQTWHVMEAMFSWFMADHETCMQSVNEGLKNAEKRGVHLLDVYLLGQGIYSGLSLGQPRSAASCLEKLAAINSQRPMDKVMYHYQASAVARHNGDFKNSIEHGKLAVTIVEGTGSPFAISLCYAELAFSLFDAGKCGEAKEQLARGREMARGMNAIEFMHLLYGARFAFELGDEEQGLALLQQGLALGAQQGYVNMSRWNNETMSRLCAKALEHGIEPEYVKMLIKKRNLAPPADSVGGDAPLQNWPYPIKIYALGRFEIVKDGKPFEFSGKVQKKPLEMLKAIIALGGRDVSEEQLTDALWPDAEGDAAHSTFKSTLHRLRQLIGKESSLTINKGHVTLDPRHCWVDVWAFQRILATVESIGEDKIRRFVKKGVSIYNGDFLIGDNGLSWAVSMRERLKGGFIRLVRMSGQNHIDSGEWEEAIKLYQKALEINDLEEEFYRALMLCYGKLGGQADVQTTYHRLGRLLASVLAVEPSPETKAVYKKAMTT